MPLELDHKVTPVDFVPLIKTSLQTYQEMDSPPKISFWGLFHIFCTEDAFAPATILGFRKDGREARLNFLKQIFGDVQISPQKYFFNSCKSEKALINHLTSVWHCTWSHKKSPRAFDKMIYDFSQDPSRALNELMKNLSKLMDQGIIDRNRAGKVAVQVLTLLDNGHLLPPDFLDSSVKPTAECSLAILIYICLLGQDIVWKEPIAVFVKGHSCTCRETQVQGLALPLSARTGLYRVDDSQLDAHLLPSIICEGKRYDYDVHGEGSPLRQIITKNSCPWIFLCGHADESGNSAVSGVGKTSSLRYLAQEERNISILWLPLAEVYSRHSMRYLDNLERYIKKKFSIDLDMLPDSSLLLLDGLDELLSPEQLERLLGDLDELQNQGKYGLVVSSKLPWEQLPYAKILYQWGNVWRNFLPCSIQNLTVAQIETALTSCRKSVDGAVHLLNTPFLLSLYLHTADIPNDPRTIGIIKRWRAEAFFQSEQLTTELLFYRALIVQIVRWSEAARGQEFQWEMDAFLLLHTFPAIAYQMLRAEVNDPSFDPAAEINIDQNYIERMISAVWCASQSGLPLFPGYNSNDPHTKCRKILDGLKHIKFMGNAAAFSLLHGEWAGGEDYVEPRFINLSFRNNLAYLHIANTFLLAYEGMLEPTETAIEAYGQTIEFMPLDQLQQVVGFFDLIAHGNDLRSILEQGPKEGTNALSQFLAGHIGLMLCENIPDFRKDVSICSDSWFHSMDDGMRQLESSGSTEFQKLVEKKFSLAYIFGLTAYSRNLRESDRYGKAANYIDLVFEYQDRHPQIKNSDGYHMKALLLWKQITSALNTETRPIHTPKPISAEDLSFADRLFRELNDIKDGKLMGCQQLGSLSAEQKMLVPIFLDILNRVRHRRSAYAERGYFNNSTIDFLCTASYVAKAYSIYAALSPGNSGVAYNLLGSLMANNSEQLENNSKLPFFKANPKLHLDVQDLWYENRFVASFKIYLRLYNIRRGSQPYSARRLCELILRRQVRLQENNQPVTAHGNEPFTDAELSFLEQATTRAMLNHGNSEAYWRVRFLHEMARKNMEHKNGSHWMDSAARELRMIWRKCSCDEKLQRLQTLKYETVDFISMLVILEDLLMDSQKEQAIRNRRYEMIFDYLRWYRNRSQEEPKFATGVCAQYSDIQDCLSRIDRLKHVGDGFIIQHMNEF